MTLSRRDWADVGAFVLVTMSGVYLAFMPVLVDTKYLTLRTFSVTAIVLTVATFCHQLISALPRRHVSDLCHDHQRAMGIATFDGNGTQGLADLRIRASAVASEQQAARERIIRVGSTRPYLSLRTHTV